MWVCQLITHDGFAKKSSHLKSKYPPEDDSPFPKVGYVSALEGILLESIVVLHFGRHSHLQ